MSLFETTVHPTTDEGENQYDIYQFLEDHRVVKGQSHTHTSMGMGKYAGSFYIRTSEMDMFYILYEKAIFQDKPLHLIEKHEEIGPIVIDFDFKYEFDQHDRVHTVEHIEKIVFLYIQEIVNLFEIEKDDARLTAFVFERNKPYKSKGITKDGIHIMFPFIVSSPEAQYYIRNQILGKISTVLMDLPVKNQPSDIVDKSVIYSNGWMMFCSTKHGTDPYTLTHIYNGELEAINLEEYDYGMRDLPRFFSIRGKKSDEVIPIREEKRDTMEKFSQKKKVSSEKMKIKVGMNVGYDLAQISEIMAILKGERAESYNSWMEIGWALHNIDPNAVEMLNLWIEFSKKSGKFEDGVCEREWDKMKNEGLGIASLYYWAKIDNYEEYRKIMEKDTNQMLNKSLETITHWDVANVLYKIYKHEFKYSGGRWYMFRNHLWMETSDGIELRQKISTELVSKYQRLISDLNKLASSEDPEITEEDKEEAKKNIGKIMGLIRELKTTSFKENLMKEAKELFYEQKFVEKLDTNPMLIGFNNGIYDLEKMELRDGRPDDYVSLSTEIDKIDFCEENEFLPDLLYFLSTVFTNEEVRNYFLTYLSSCLQGVNQEQRFRVWTGTGGNGKSLVNNLFKMAYGQYCINLPITLLTGKRANSNAPTPEIVQTKGKRYAYLEEPDSGERINVGIMKNWSGTDTIKGRGLNKDPIEFKAQFKMALLCNDIPALPAHDGGVWRRMEIIEFKSQFVDNPREEGEFKKDYHLEEKLTHWKELFMAMLIDVYYKDYKTHGIHVPAEVTKFTSEFQKQSDMYGEFMSDALDETKEKTDVVEIDDIYNEFRLWFVEENSDHKVPAKTEFKKYLKQKYKTKMANTKEIRGVKFRSGYQKKSSGGAATVMGSISTMNGVV
jgi:P4 family phage/plasmid primase-like protien